MRAHGMHAGCSTLGRTPSLTAVQQSAAADCVTLVMNEAFSDNNKLAQLMTDIGSNIAVAGTLM